MNGSANSLQSRRYFGERVLSNFMTQIVAAILILTAAEGWGEKQIKRGMGVGEWRFRPAPPPHPPTVHSNCKSNMDGRINDRELITLALTNKTPALQATLQMKWLTLNWMAHYWMANDSPRIECCAESDEPGV